MTKKQQVHELINNLRERSHVVEFAEKCAKRAESYATCVARRSAASADYTASAVASAAAYAAAFYSTYTTDATTAAAADAADAAADCVSATERETQITHLKELHAREESQTKD